MRAWPLVAIAALGIAIAALILWFAGRDEPLPTTGIAQTAQIDDLRVTLWLDQDALGPRLIELRVADAAGRPADLQAVRLRFSMADMDMGTIQAEAQPLGRGRYQARGAFFSMAGQWQVVAEIEREGQPGRSATFALPIAAPGEVGGPLNPLPADPATRAAGGRLYAEHCAVCHGASGQGDGPLAAGLAPRPGDLTQHMLPGKHTDGQVFLWIKQGFPSSAMPAWGNRLDDQQIWQIVAYLRGLAQPLAATAVPQTPLTPTPGALPTEAPTTAPAAREPLPPLIFTRQGNLWRSDGSPAPPRQLTHLDAAVLAAHPAIAPDARTIAFIGRAPGPITATLPVSITTLYLMNADGSSLRAIWQPPRGELALPAWAPDSRTLYVGHSELRSDPQAPVADWLFEIVRVDTTTGERQTVIGDARDPAISGDGALMAYLHFDRDSAAFSLHVAAPDGTADREVVAAGNFSTFYAPRFSPDGKRLIFAAIGGPVTDDQGYPIRAQRSAPLEALLGLFAPAVAEAHGAPWDVWVVNTDGTGLRRLPGMREDTPMAIFTPDGRQIVMIGAGGIYLADADGKHLRLIDRLGDHGGLDWVAH
jgi:mono/diheme cytochrome c family protein/Tol biopolymer transport system component